MKVDLYLFLPLLCVGMSQPGKAQFYGFEDKVPKTFSASALSLSTEHAKEGKKSLEWRYAPGETLTVTTEPLTLNKQRALKSGIALWLYNESGQNDSVRIEFLTPDGTCSYRMGFGLQAVGWRACWSAFQYMEGNRQPTTITAIRFTAPQQAGRLFIDRFTFPVEEANRRTTPDWQTPYNNDFSNPQLAHWCHVWQWEQLPSDLPLTPLSMEEEKTLKNIEYRLLSLLESDHPAPRKIETAYELFKKAAIRRSGRTVTGAPLVAPDDKGLGKGVELTLNDLETMLYGFALDAYYNRTESALTNYFTVWDYALDQGFAFGSGMGTNHHCGYQIRAIYTSAWLLRDAIWKSDKCDAIVSTLAYWAALQETRQPCPAVREGLLDAWHTQLMPRLISALMHPDIAERARSLKGFSRWLSSSLQYTPGTSGGIKPDGTTFHHGGFYPAYTTGMMALFGQYLYLTSGTTYRLTKEARTILGNAFTTMRNCCNKTEWGIGISGRHPFAGSMKADDVLAYAYFALAEAAEGNTDDAYRWASDYLRLSDTNTALTRKFRNEGVRQAKAPQGFFVYNYGATGIFRRNNWMVTLKGYNTDVWGSEIYVHDNRYGRYQSYGSVQIMGAPSRQTSGYEAAGWDWNRLPGTTTIHLPYALLDSPVPNSLMARSPERFAGCSSLEGMNGVFAIKLAEPDRERFTPDFKARKSVFCFENRMVCLGTNIHNSNAAYPTETTLFQSAWIPYKGVWIDNQRIMELGTERKADCTNGATCTLRDCYDNWYYVRHGVVKIQAKEQESRDERTRATNKGAFASAWIDHGTAPDNDSYEYLVLIQPDEQTPATTNPLDSYQVLQADDKLHAVVDRATGITACVAFEATTLSDAVIRALPEETFVIYRPLSSGALRMSICSPDLNIADKTGSTTSPCQPLSKTVTIAGAWRVASGNVEALVADGVTRITATCQHGLPVEFTLVKP